MKNVFLKAYCKNNLGDDLFLHIISNRYNDNFISVCSPKYKYYKRYKNIKFNKSFLKYYFYRILEKITQKDLLESKFINSANLFLHVGGSIFIENGPKEIYRLNKQITTNKIPYFILGANFGPYYSKNYKNIVENKIFCFATDVCFRDNCSYNLFKTLENVRKAADIVFSLDMSNITIKEENNVIISVINCENRFSKNISTVYEKKIVEMIDYFNSLDYTVTLMSFCQAEGDEKIINKLLKKYKKVFKNKKINKYFYRGDLTEALNILGSSKIIVGCRFHANVLGILMNKQIIPIAYSDKTINLLEDLEYNGKIYDIRKIESFDIHNLEVEKLNYKIDISKHIMDAEKQFLILDAYLTKR